MKNIILIVVVIGFFILVVLGVGSTLVGGDGTDNHHELVSPDDRVPTTVSPPVKTCADVNCNPGYYCVIEDQTPYCIKEEQLSPPPPSETIYESGVLKLGVSEWDCGYQGTVTDCTRLITRAPNSKVWTYGHVIVPKTGNYIIETGFIPYALSIWSYYTADKSACDGNPYYSGKQMFLEAGKEYWFEFEVKQPAYPGTYLQYFGVWTGCESAGGYKLKSVERQVSIR